MGDGFTCTKDPNEDVVDATTQAPATASPEISTCPGTASAEEQGFCTAAPQSTVCVQNQNYKNQFCALCNGATSDMIVAGPCNTDPADFVASCPADADAELAQECTFFAQDFYCDVATESKTFKNIYCARCNGLDDTAVRSGACRTGSFVHPCAAVDCPAHSDCALTVADCDFEDTDYPLCGWTNVISSDTYDYDQFNWDIDANGTYTNGTGPSVDHTFGTATGHYLYIEASKGQATWEAHLTSPIFNPSELGTNCRFGFWYHMYGADVDTLAVDIREANTSDFVNVWTVHGANDRGEVNHDQWVNHAHIWLGSYKKNIQVRIMNEEGGKRRRMKKKKMMKEEDGERKKKRKKERNEEDRKRRKKARKKGGVEFMCFVDFI